jgi:acyl-CoA reductase-like NAD-dependent aldehyde dehydrogenase
LALTSDPSRSAVNAERAGFLRARRSGYGLNASVFSNDIDRAHDVARRLRSGTVGHNAFGTDFGIAFGGFVQSGIGREGELKGCSRSWKPKQ